MTENLSANALDVMAADQRSKENAAKRATMKTCGCNAMGLPHYHTDTEGIIAAPPVESAAPVSKTAQAGTRRIG